VLLTAQTRLSELAAERAREELTDPEWRVMRPELLARVETAQRRYDAARSKGSLASLPQPLSAAWSDFTPTQRRATVTDLVAEVRVDSAVRGRNRYDGARVHLVWNV
jgi:hypothetical protein